MTRVLGVALFCIGLLCLSQTRAQSPLSFFGYGPGSVGGAASCTQGTNALANTSLVSGSTFNNIMTAICGMVTDGTYASLDILYLFATDSAADAKVNLANSGASTGFNLVTSGSCSFTVNQGFTGDASTCVGDPTYNPTSAAGNFAQNSASLGACVLTSRTTPQNYVALGGHDAFVYAYIQPLLAGPLFSAELNAANFPTVSEGNAQGSWIASRTASGAIALYLNGSSIATPTDSSVGNLNDKILVFATNNNGSTTQFTGDQMGYAFMGGGLSSGQVSSVYSRLHTFMAAQGNSAC